jgi:diaminohydroxyphosphoribosylaminopyrimidine deaminase/5-amino-6-(5-phosphoribosylamino)uracil reductase
MAFYTLIWSKSEADRMVWMKEDKLQYPKIFGFFLFMKNIDEKYMRLALDLARKAKGRTSPNPMVGAVIVRDNEIVGTGYHHKAGTPHAEVHAITDAGNETKGATIYVSLEPCSHYGRTGPCTEAIIKAGISRVVMAMPDPNPKVDGKAILESHGVEVTTGILEDEARKLNEFFVKYITTKLPFVILKTAMSLDGKIATRSGKSKWITSEDSRRIVHQIRDEVDAIIVGIGTVIADDPSLTTRLTDGDGHDAIRIILDSHARIPLESKVLNLNSTAKTIIVVSPLAPDDKINKIRQRAEVLVVPEKNGRIDIQELMINLAKMEITSVLIEGGSEVNASAIKSGIVDRIMFFIAPKLFGGREAPGPIGGDGIDDPSEAIKLNDISVTQVGEDILITGTPM